ncbi:MAG TPA: class I SAM-dependent methyltransferase [Phycisphaerales bacterium]|nr:class I SAM-dependent methyltransferase [Phycisphaerales bacterium]
MSMTTLAPAQSSTVEFFESVYAEAHGDAARVRWADERSNPALVNWLNAVAPSLVRCGARACVVGCGLGDDAQELIKRGYDVTAFDCAPTAVDWARRRDPENARNYVQADLFNMPAKWRHRFDLVVEIYTIQSLPPERHEAAMKALAEILSPHGHMLLIARAATDDGATMGDERPWPLTEDALRRLCNVAGLNIMGDVAIFEDDEDPPVVRMRAVLNKRA